jgi:hypothetical protein
VKKSLFRPFGAKRENGSPTVTLNVFGHLMKDRNPEAAARLECAVF